MAEKKMSHKEFVTNAIQNLRTEGYKGIHSVWTGFNEAFRAYYNECPIAATNKLQEEGIIEVRPAKGGVMLYLAGEKPANKNDSKGKAALDKIINGKKIDVI